MSWGEVFGKIFNWIPKKEERYRVKISDIRRKMDALAKKPSTPDNRAKYVILAEQLRVFEERLQALP